MIGVLKGVEEFLGIPEEFTSNIRVTEKEICLVTHSVLGTYECIKKRIHQFDPVPKHVTDALKAVFKPHMQEFYRMIGRDFGW